MKVVFYLIALVIVPGFFFSEVKAQTTGANIILNPSFDTDDAGWGHYFDYFWDPSNPLAAKASLSVEAKAGYTGKAYKVTILDAGTADYSVQISYPVALEAGKKYSIKFKASSDASRTTAIAFQQDTGPKTNWYISSAIKLTTTPTVFGPYYYTATTTDPSNLFKFYLGGGGTANGISAYFDDVEVAEIINVAGATVPGAPTGVVATPGSSKATVAFTAPANTGGLNIKSYTVRSNPKGITATSAASPITVNGLSDGQAYTFTVVATNAMGSSAASEPSNAVTPAFKAVSYFVSSGSGNDNNDGLTTSTAWATLTKAANTMFPGDTAFVMTGIYPPFTIRNSGTLDRRITYKAYAGNEPVITCGLKGDWNLLQISASNITIDGLEVKGINQSLTLAQGEANYNKILGAINAGTPPDYQSTTNTNTNGVSIGEAVIGVVHHITVKNCKIHECSAGGVGATNADYLILENNEIYNNCWYTMWAPSGISVIHLTGTDAGSNTVIRGNKVYNNYTLVKWISIRAFSDGNGIIIDVNDGTDAGFPAYTGKFLVENNLVFDNGGRGLYIMSSQNALFRNNTSYWNSKSSFSDGGEMVVFASKDVTFVNNIGWANPAYSSMNFGIRDDGAWGTNSNITWKNNIAFNGTVGNSAVYLNKTTTTSIDNSNKLGINPLFVNPTITTATANFRLQKASPAIDAGTLAYGVPAYDIEYYARTQGNGVDLGAYESNPLIPLALSLLNFSGKRINGTTVEISWNTKEEILFDYFDVERANDGKSFQQIASVKSNGLAKNNYQYTDNSATEAQLYYRLKMVNKDGKFTYSNIITLANGENAGVLVDVYPNPTFNAVTNIYIKVKENGLWHVSVINRLGQVVKRDNYNLVKGANKLKMNLSNFAPGVYFLTLENNGQFITRKVVKN
jgi:hypothetical protein